MLSYGAILVPFEALPDIYLAVRDVSQLGEDAVCIRPDFTHQVFGDK